MRRRLILMRHAKSSWKSDAADDHSRPLNKRGRRDAPAVAQALKERDWTPELVYSSDSKRTSETLALMCGSFATGHELKFVYALYHAVSWFTGEHHMMGTANAALLVSEAESWREVLRGERAWQLLDVVRPKDLPSAE